MEPSYLSGLLGAFFYYYLLKFINEEHSFANSLKVIFTVFMAVISYSTTAYVVIALACLITIIQLNKVKQLIRALGIGVPAICILLFVVTKLGMWEKIIRNSIEKLDTSSALVRGTWNDACVQAFKDTFGIGIGLGNLFGSSFAFTLLGSTGVIGTLSYIFFILNTISPRLKHMTKNNDSERAYVFRFKIMLILSIAAQMIAVGRFNYSIFWMLLFILMAVYSVMIN